MVLDNNILDFIKKFEQFEIELIAYGGSNVVFIRDNTFKPSSTNFIINLNKCLNRVLPYSNGQLKNKSKFNKEILEKLKKSNWNLRKGNNHLFPGMNDGYLFMDFAFDNIKFKYSIILWPYLSINNKYFLGLRDNGIYDRKFLDNPVRIKDIYPSFPFEEKILMPNHHEKFLKCFYGDYSKKKSGKMETYGYFLTILFDDENKIIVTKEKKQNRLGIPEEYLNFVVL